MSAPRRHAHLSQGNVSWPVHARSAGAPPRCLKEPNAVNLRKDCSIQLNDDHREQGDVSANQQNRLVLRRNDDPPHLVRDIPQPHLAPDHAERLHLSIDDYHEVSKGFYIQQCRQFRHLFLLRGRARKRLPTTGVGSPQPTVSFHNRLISMILSPPRGFRKTALLKYTSTTRKGRLSRYSRRSGTNPSTTVQKSRRCPPSTSRTEAQRVGLLRQQPRQYRPAQITHPSG